MFWYFLQCQVWALVMRFCAIMALMTLMCAGISGCGELGDDRSWSEQRDALRDPTQLYFAYPTDGKFTTESFYNFPYPHELRLNADGTPSLAAFPNPKREQQCQLPPSTDQLVSSLLKSINPDTYIADLVKATNEQAAGFSLNPAIHFRFNRALHPRSIPDPASSMGDQSPIFLVDIDQHSPNKGQRIPIMIHSGLKSRFLPDTVVVMRPLPGFVLRRNTRYAAVMLDKVRDADGWPLVAPASLTSLAEAVTPADEPLIQKLKQTYLPMFELLAAKWQIPAAQVVAATVFTTGDPLIEQSKLRDFVWNELPAPSAPQDLKCVPNNAATPFITCTGIYDSPHFQKGKAPFLDPDSGFFVYDAQKRPQHHMLPLRFALTIPKRYIQTGAVAQRAMPIVMYAHGTGGSYTSFISDGTARSLAQQGIAGFGIDQAVNGERTTKIGDARLDFLFFNALNYPAARDNVRQSAIDYYWQVRFLRDLSIDYNKQSFTFDHKRIWFMGHSQGGLTGPLLLAFEEHISAAYLSAPGGYLIHTLMYKIKPAEPIMLPAIVRYLICDGDDNVTPFHPILSLVQNFYDPADPVNYAAPILDGSRSPLNFLMTIGLTDSYAPPQVFDPLAVAMGLPLLGPLHHPIPGLQLRQIPQYKLPVHGNFLHPLGNRTSVGFTQHPECKYSSGGDCDGHFVAHHNPDAQRNWISFFQSLVNGDIATIH